MWMWGEVDLPWWGKNQPHLFRSQAMLHIHIKYTFTVTY